MNGIVELEAVRKSFEGVPALDGITTRIEGGRIVGLVGRNGSGKSTLLRLLCGLVLPSAGRVVVLGRDAADLGDEDLRRLGVVHQENRFLGWMRVREHLDYTASFFPRWDRHLVRRLCDELELDEEARISTLSPGNVQKLALVTALGHRPELLLLDEPVSALDPLARESLLRFLLEVIQDQETSIVISSHVLRDVERVVDWVLCLDRGRLVVDGALDDLAERYGEWRVTSLNGELPQRFPEGFVLSQEGDRHQALLCVLDARDALGAFEQRYHARVEALPLNLERMFPLWTRSEAPSLRGPGSRVR